MSFFFHWLLGPFGSLRLPNDLVLDWSPAGAVSRDQISSASIWSGVSRLLFAASISELEVLVLDTVHSDPLLNYLQREVLQHREAPPKFAGNPLITTLDRAAIPLLWRLSEPDEYQVEVIYRGNGLFEAVYTDLGDEPSVSAEGSTGAEAVQAVEQALPRKRRISLGLELSTWWERL